MLRAHCHALMIHEVTPRYRATAAGYEANIERVFNEIKTHLYSMLSYDAESKTNKQTKALIWLEPSCDWEQTMKKMCSHILPHVMRKKSEFENNLAQISKIYAKDVVDMASGLLHAASKWTGGWSDRAIETTSQFIGSEEKIIKTIFVVLCFYAQNIADLKAVAVTTGAAAIEEVKNDAKQQAFRKGVETAGGFMFSAMTWISDALHTLEPEYY